MRDAILAHALTARAERQRCVVKFLFRETLRMGENHKPVQGADILTHCPGGTEAKDPKTAARGLIRDIGYRLKKFFDNHPESLKLAYRVEFQGEGNYLLRFEPNKPRPQEPDLVPLFWKPYFPGAGTALMLYPEPQFFIDGQGTYFRNPRVGTTANKAALDYLHIPGPLETSYSYVPSGIVQAILYLTKKLREYEHENAEFPACHPIKPSLAIPPDEKNLIVLATPTSSELVDTLQADMPMTVSAAGVTIEQEPEPYDDNARMKWGVLTRRPHRHRIVTLLAAKHGRAVEAMAQYLTLHGQLARLAQKLERVNEFPGCFQVLFRMPMVNTKDGPSIDDTRIEKVIIADPEEMPESSKGGYPGQA